MILTARISSTRREDLQMLLLNSKKKWWKMSVVVTSFSNDDRAYHPTLLKTVPIIDILIDHFNFNFKEHPWKAATILQKAYCLREVVEICLMIAPLKKNSYWSQNTESIDVRFQCPKFRLVRCFTLSFYYTGLCTGH